MVICSVYHLVSHKTAPWTQICCRAITWRRNNSRFQLGTYFWSLLCHSWYIIIIIIIKVLCMRCKSIFEILILSNLNLTIKWHFRGVLLIFLDLLFFSSIVKVEIFVYLSAMLTRCNNTLRCRLNELCAKLTVKKTYQMSSINDNFDSSVNNDTHS